MDELDAAVRDRARDPRATEATRLDQQRAQRVTPQEKRSIVARLTQVIAWLAGHWPW